MSSSGPFGGGGGRPEAGGVAAPLAQGAQGSDGAADQPVVPDLLLLRAAHRLLAQDHSGRHGLMHYSDLCVAVAKGRKFSQPGKSLLAEPCT